MTDATGSVDRNTVRAEIYGLLAGVLAGAPSHEQLGALASADLLGSLYQRAARSGLGDLPELCELATTLGTTEESWDAVGREFNELFLGPGPLPAPPWESVYLSPERLVMQAPARAVLRAYVDAGLGYDSMIGCPPDHVAKELGFMAALIGGVTDAEAAPERRGDCEDAFLHEHLARWVPRFCDDLERAAAARWYRAVACLLRRFLDVEVRGDLR